MQSGATHMDVKVLHVHSWSVNWLDRFFAILPSYGILDILSSILGVQNPSR